MRLYWVVVLQVALLSGCSTQGRLSKEVRIDATSVETAEASYREMMNARSPRERPVLGFAVLMLNLEGVQSANEALAVERGSIGPIKDKVAGLTADQIIKRAEQVKDPKIVLMSTPAQ